MMQAMKARPTTRKRFERNIYLHAEVMRQGKLMFYRGISVEGLERARKLPNGRIDLLSIDEMTRLQANMTADMMAQGFGAPSDVLDPD